MAIKLNILFFALFIQFASVLVAQEPDIVSFEGRAGFPVSQINHIKQDRFGYIWIASAQGLYRFDGTRFARVAPDAGLTKKNIVALYADADSSIWASAIDGETWNVRRNSVRGHYKVEEPFNRRAPINATYRKVNDTLIFQTYGQYTLKLTADSVTQVSSSKTSDLVVGLINRLDERWHLQFTFYLQLNFDTLVANRRFKSGSVTVVNGEDNASIYYGNLLISATSDSIGARFTTDYLLDQKQANGATFKSLYGKGLVVCYEKTGATDTLMKHFNVTSIFVDDNNGVWIGTLSRGLFYIRNFLVRNYPSRHLQATIKYNDIAAFGDTLLMLANHKLMMLDINARRSEQLLTLPFVAQQIFVLPDQRLVLMGMRKIAIIHKSNAQWVIQTTLTNVEDINYGGAFYREHFYTIGLKGIYKHNLNLWGSAAFALSTKRIRFLTVCNDQLYAADPDSLWVFSNDEPIKQFPFFENSYFGSDGSKIFVARKDGEISVLKGMADTLAQITNKENVRHAFAFNNKLFISSFNGVVVHRMDSLNHSQTRFFDISSGLRNSNVRKTLRLNNKLAFLHDAGVAISPDTSFSTSTEFMLDVNASGQIKKDGQRIRVDIGRKTKHLQIKFSTFHFERLFRNGLLYRVEDDSVWRPMMNNEMSLVNLKSGETNITVSIPQSLTKASEHYHVVIYKELRWGEKVWVQILLFIIIVTLISFIMHSRVRHIQQKSELNASQISQLQTVLRQQMNPHFIFNSLTSINHYILQNKRIEASRFLTKFSTLIRNILDYSGGNNITLSEEIDVIDGYLSLEALRFKGRFSYSIHVDPSIDKNKILIPPFIIYPFVERALREGLIHKESKGNIIVRFRSIGSYMQCAVMDDGVGLRYFHENVNKSKNSINKNGTQIAKQRIELYNTLCKEKILLHTEDVKNAADEIVGTNVLIRFPLIKA